jgi:hypothetical protein
LFIKKGFFERRTLFYFVNVLTYACAIADVGQASAHAPQSMHLSASIVYGSPSEIASAGHSGRQDPQAIHSSLIL